MNLFLDKDSIKKNYNGSTQILQKLSDLLNSGKVTAKATLPLIIESLIHEIKQRHEIENKLRLQTFGLFVYIAYSVVKDYIPLPPLEDIVSLFSGG